MKSRRAGRPFTFFVAFQAVILTAGAGWAAWCAIERHQERALPSLRQKPRWVRPLYDNPLVVTDEQLRQVLNKLLPRFRQTRPPVSTVDHALRFWGYRAVFNSPEALSGKEMHRLMVDHDYFREFYGKDALPLLEDLGEGKGIRYRTLEGQLTSSHVDHTLACLAEVGTPLDFPVRTDTRTTTLVTIVEQSLRDFSLNQGEYEWNALVYALYMEAPGTWVTQEGQSMDFDRIADRIMRERLPRGVCSGQHRMHALVMLLRVDNEQRILSDAGRQRVVDYLQGVTGRLVRSQRPDGSWDGDWESAPTDGTDSNKVVEDVSDLSTRLLVTGHALEWWSLAPAELLPPRETLVRAGQWAVQAILGLDQETITRRFGPLSHAGRALALWRGRWPYQVELGPVPAKNQPDETAISASGKAL